MKVTRQGFDRLLGIWRRSYHEKIFAPADAPRRSDVMRAVRRIGPLHTRAQPIRLLGQLAWRLTPVTALLIIASAVILLSSDFTPGHSLLVSLITDPEEVTLSQFLPL